MTALPPRQGCRALLHCLRCKGGRHRPAHEKARSRLRLWQLRT